jgi:uncharacterized cupredoxin-like copper-binding protein
MKMGIVARHLASRWIIGGLAALLLTACSAATAAPPTAAGPAAVTVELKTYSVTPNPATARAGEVTFNVTNGATDHQHEFVVIQSDLAPHKLPVGSDSTVEEDAVTVVDELAEMDPGKTGTLTVNLAAGQYVLICNRPGHYQAGMHTSFTVTS